MLPSSTLRKFGFGLVILVGTWLLAINPVNAQDQAQIELGARLYAENCSVCHGETGEGRVGATLAKDWPSIRPDLRVRSTIENGITGTPMVPWGQSNGGPLSAEEIDALVAYILTWESGGPRYIAPTPTFSARPLITAIPDVEGDPNQGAALFDQNCVVCHGADGQGRVGAALAKNFSSVRPDLTVKNTISNGIANSPMPAWSQAKGGPLTEQEINDLTAFVLTLADNPVVFEQPSLTEAVLQPSWLRGWGGIILAMVLFGLIVGFALWIQNRNKA
jgi:cytochrome c oxidase cbb3-type subunit 3